MFLKKDEELFIQVEGQDKLIHVSNKNGFSINLNSKEHNKVKCGRCENTNVISNVCSPTFMCLDCGWVFHRLEK